MSAGIFSEVMYSEEIFKSDDAYKEHNEGQKRKKNGYNIAHLWSDGIDPFIYLHVRIT